MKEIKCDGSCDAHTGDVLLVQVKSAEHDWGTFWYCETARKEDEKRGLTVEVCP